MVNKKIALAAAISAVLIGLFAITVGTARAAEWERYEIRITSPSPGTVTLQSGQTLHISGTLTKDGQPLASHPNAVTIMSEGKVVAQGSNIYQGQWTCAVKYEWFVSAVGTGVHEYYAVWKGNAWGISTWLSQGNVLFVDLVPAVQKWTLTTSVNPAGSGTVTPSSGEYNDGTIVDIKATAASGYTFSHWSGDASGTTPNISVVMNGNKSITANFTTTPEYYTLTTSVSPAGSGTITLNPLPGTLGYAKNTVVSATANPSAGYTFSHWSGSVGGTASTVQILMDGNKSITANFVAKDGVQIYQLTTYVAEGSGTVDPSGTTTYYSGETAVITATPASGWSFDRWSGDAQGSQNPTTITMNANKTIGAHFKQTTPQTVTLTMISSPPDGGIVTAQVSAQITPQVTQSVFTKGTSVSIAAFPNQGWGFDYWSGDAVGTTQFTTILMDTDKTVIAVFSQEEPWWQATEVLAVLGIVAVAVIAGVAILVRRR